jgi:hypothetical protein
MRLEPDGICAEFSSSSRASKPERRRQSRSKRTQFVVRAVHRIVAEILDHLLAIGHLRAQIRK